MSDVRIKLLNEKHWRTRPPFDAQKQLAHARALAPNDYLILPRMYSAKEGLKAAEEMFDLTNNPSREIERLARYGNGRSVSSGDVVCVDGIDYLCLSIGWAHL